MKITPAITLEDTGSGIIHQEMPKGDAGGWMGGFQLWANLPASHKMMDPRYRDVQSGQVPEVRLAGGRTVRVICREVEGTRGPVQDVVVDPQYLDVNLPPGATLIHPTKPGHTVFAYVIEGQACFCQEKDPFAYEAEGQNYFDYQRRPLLPSGSLVLCHDGEQLVVSAEEQPARFLLVAGRPIGEPVAWYGPIVMNTRDELRVAFEEYEKGTFVKKGQRR